MKVRINKTGEVLEDVKYIDTTLSTITIQYLDDGVLRETRIKNLSDIEEVKDYEKPLFFFNESIREAIRAWWKLQENPFKCASVLCINDSKDKDGFYNYHIYGYIREGENKLATEFQFRTKCYYQYIHHKDYTLEELCGGEE